MKKADYNEAQNLQHQIEHLEGENRMLQDARDKIDDKDDTDFTVHIEGIEPKQEASVHFSRPCLRFNNAELMDTIDERMTSNNQKITKLTNKFDAL